MQKFKFILVIFSSFFLSSCVDQPPAPIEYGTSHSRNSDSQNGNEYYDASLEASKSYPRKKTLWGGKEIEDKEDNSSTPIVATGKDHYHEVIEGESVDSIAKKYNISREVLIKANDLEEPYQLEELQLLLIPKGHKLDVKKKPTSKITSVSMKKISVLPVNGKIVSNFGEKYMGAVNQGINISAAQNSEVKLISSGEVIHSGYDPKFGNLIIVRSNGDNIFEAYAHLSELKYKVGEELEAGSIIGNVGTSGMVTKPQLHFAIRRGKIPIDPVEYVKN